ncbi:ATP-binding cassette sub-family A member 1, partial [Elysia marginata]
SGASDSNLSINIGSSGFTTLQKARLFFQQFCALFEKRFHNFKRSIRAFATQILAPALFVCLSTIVTLIIPISKEMPPLELQPWHLEIDNQPLVTFYRAHNTLSRPDLTILSSDLHHKHNIQVLDDIGSDHLPILTTLHQPCNKKFERKTRWNFKKANWSRFKQTTDNLLTAIKPTGDDPNLLCSQITEDGSAFKGTINGGYGVRIQYPDKTKDELSESCGSYCSNYEAEAFAIESAVFQLTSVFSLYPEKTQNIVIFSDSKSALEELQNENLQNSSLKSLFLTIDSFLKTYDVDLTLQWIPGHCNITGNERADTLAKKGSTAQQQNTTTSFRTAQQIIRNNSTEEWLNGWATGKTGRSLFTYMATPNPKDSINSLERRDQVIIFRLRTHHAPVNAHLNRIQPMTPLVCHFCDAPYETTTHLLFQCTSLQDLREEYLPPRPDAWNTLYSNSQQLKKTSTFYSQMSSRRAKAQTTAGSDNNDNRSNQLSNKLENSLIYYPDYGTRCLDKDVYSIRGKPCHSSKRYEAGAELGDLKNHLDCQDDGNKCTLNYTGKTLLKGRLRTNDYLYDLSGQNNTHWLLSTESRYRMSRYGGFTFLTTNDLGLVDQKDISSALKLVVTTLDIIIGVPYEDEKGLKFEKKLETLLDFAYNGENIKVWINNHGWHAGTSYVNGVNNLLLRALLPENQTADEYGIVTTSHPLRRTEAFAIRDAQEFSGGFLASAICILFAFSFVPAGFVVFVVEEKSSNSKDLQILCGIKPFLYWLVNWMWDMVNYIIAVVLCILILLAFDREEFVSERSLRFFVTLLMLYGWSVTPLMYILCRFFKEPSSAFVILAGINVFLGTLSTLSVYVPSLINMKIDGGELIFDDTLSKVLSFVPHFCLTKGILDMCLFHAETKLKLSFGASVDRSLMDWDQSGLGIVLMAVMGLVFNILVLVLEEPWCLSLMRRLRLRKSKTIASKAEVVEEDVDVMRENQRVLSGEASNDMLRLEELTKVHFGSSLPAVNRLSVGVPQAQCFGLLGVNGAGKSTTFKMLTGNLSVTSGDAFVAGYSVCSNMGQVRQLIGYCPQSDALNPLLTGREHLEFYAKARGTEPDNVKLLAIWAIKTLGLTAYADNVVQSYSGGNKRKLSIAIALIGGPPVIFLVTISEDEPTAGMDPVARRFLWNCINKVVKSGKTVILTSHSMEECEALCNRLAIMVNGKFQCLGSLQHLKHRFGGGYTIILRVGGVNPDLTNIHDFISSSLPSAKLVEHRYNMLQYQLGKSSTPLSKLFKTMESAKVSHGVEDYSVSQTTLEQVFMNFAKNQKKRKYSPTEEEERIPLKDLGKRG